jgi:hypothetical protein
VANDGELPFDYYYHYRPGDEVTGIPGGFFDLDPPRTMRRAMTTADLAPLRLRLRTHHYDQVVLLVSHEFWGDPNYLTRRLVGQEYSLTDKVLLYDVKVQIYAPLPR